MPYNSPAIKGVCITRPVLTEASGRSIRVGSWYFSRLRPPKRFLFAKEGKAVTSKTLTERSGRHGVQDCLTALSDSHRTGGRRQAGKAKSVTTVPAVALAEAGQLAHIVWLVVRYFYF
jgi:hypothetical protein